MNLQNSFSSLQIRQFHRDSSVETTGTQKGFVQCFGTVGSCQNDNTFCGIETVHFCQQLVQGLFPFVVAAHAVAVTFFTDGINFVDEYDTRCFFPRLFEQVTNFRRTHTYEHFHKFRTGNGEERYIGFPSYCLGKQCFTSTRRAYQQGAFWHFRTYAGVFRRVMQKVYDFFQCFFRFILSCHIFECLAGLGFYINLGIGLAKSHGVGTKTAFFHHSAEHQPPEQEEQQEHDEGTHPWRNFFGLNGGEVCPSRIQTIYQHIILHPYGAVEHFMLLLTRENHCLGFLVGIFFQGIIDHILIDLYLIDILCSQFVQEHIVTYFLHRVISKHGQYQPVDDKHYRQGNEPVINQRLLLVFHIHSLAFLLFVCKHIFLQICFHLFQYFQKNFNFCF